VNSCREISGRHVWVCSSHLLRSFAPLDSRGRPHACCLCGLSRGDYTRRRGGCLLPGLWILVLTAVLSLGTVNLGRMGASGSRSSGNARSGLDCPSRRKWRHPASRRRRDGKCWDETVERSCALRRSKRSFTLGVETKCPERTLMATSRSRRVSRAR